MCGSKVYLARAVWPNGNTRLLACGDAVEVSRAIGVSESRLRQLCSCKSAQWLQVESSPLRYRAYGPSGEVIEGTAEELAPLVGASRPGDVRRLAESKARVGAEWQIDLVAPPRFRFLRSQDAYASAKCAWRGRASA